jgi:hypothetical protein
VVKRALVPTCDDRRCTRVDGLAEWGRGLWCSEHLGPVIEGAARMASVRQRCGLPLSELDERALAWVARRGRSGGQ